MNIKQLLQEFCEYSLYIRGYTPSTIQRYKDCIGFYLKHTGITQLDEVTKQNVGEFFRYGRSVRGWTPESFITYHKSIVVFFRWCVENGHMQENPADGIELPKKRKRLPQKLTQDEAVHILRNCQEHDWYSEYQRHRNTAIVALFLYTGIRRQELLQLLFEDVNLQEGYIFVRSGKGQKDRYVPFPPVLSEWLTPYLRVRARARRTTRFFFTSSIGDKGFENKGLTRLVKVLKDISGIYFSAHKLRHSFATMMLEGGCDIYSLSRIMGHADISTTTIYLAASPNHLREQIEKHPMGALQKF